MKKVLLIADSNMSLSGVPVVFMSIVRQLHKEYSFDIIVLKDNDMYFEKEFLSYGGKVIRFKCEKPDSFFSKLKWLLFTYPREVKSFLNKNIDLKEYSVIHSFHEGFSFPFLKAAKKAGVKNRILHICSAKSAYPLEKTFSQSLFNWYQKKAMRCCSNIVFVSQRSLELNDYKNKGVVLYNIYDESKFSKIAQCNHNNIVLTQIATYSFRKNQLFSLEVLKLIKKTIPSVKLNIVGKELEEGYLDKMNKYIADNELNSNVVFCGNLIDRNELNKDTSYLIYPSTMESFGLVLIESQACGIHCFANKGIPNDADMGNVDFIELDVRLWADSIVNYFIQNGNKRKEPINKEKFSQSQFKQTLSTLYKN